MPTTNPTHKQPAKVGILFVHGMGDHQRGDALRAFGEPLHYWLAAWLGRGNSNRGGIVLDAHDSSFRVPPHEEPHAPAYTVVETTFRDETTQQRHRVTWVAADGWWADEIAQPRFSRVASWGLGLAPWMIVRHFRLRNRHRVLLLPSLALVVLFQIVILALTLLGVVPAFRGFVASVQLRITGAIGDVMVMVASPLQFHAMTMRLVRDLTWLRCRVGNGPIAIIAHSQGTGVAHSALQESDERVDLFVTFGTALEKLHIARQVQRNQRRLALGSSLTTAGVILLALAVWAWILADPFTSSGGDAYMAVRWLLGGGLVLLLARMSLWFHLTRLGGAGLTAVGLVLFLAGLALVSGVVVAADESIVTVVGDTWSASTWRDVADWWHIAALMFFGFAVFVVILREVVAWRKKERNWAGGPATERDSLPLGSDDDQPAVGRPSSARVRSYLVFRALADPSSVFGSFIAVWTFILGLFCLAMVSGLVPETQDNQVDPRYTQDDPILLLIIAGLALCLAAVPVPVTRASEAKEKDLRLKDRGGLEWHHYWATADPVPDKDLPVDRPPAMNTPPYVTNHMVYNEDSLLADHTTYGENTEEFLADIVRHLTKLAGSDPIGPDGAAIIARARTRRRWRVRFLVWARRISVVGVVLCWVILGPAGLAPIGGPLQTLLGTLGSVIPGLDAGDIERWLPPWVLGMIVVAIITTLWFRAGVFQAWRYWDKAEASFMYRRETPRHGRVGSPIFERRFAIALFALGTVVAISTAIWSPYLVRLVDNRLNLIVLEEELRAGAILREPLGPWIPDWLADVGPWEWPWWLISLAATLAATVLYALFMYWSAALLPTWFPRWLRDSAPQVRESDSSPAP